MIKRVEHLGKFVALDADGKRYIIDINVEILAAPTAENPDQEKDGIKRLTVKGKVVKRLSRGKYRILHGGTELFSNDPGAP